MHEKAIIQLQKLFKFYQVGLEIIKDLRNINLTMYVAIMELFGSEKSTMMNILSCLDKLTYEH